VQAFRVPDHDLVKACSLVCSCRSRSRRWHRPRHGPADGPSLAADRDRDTACLRCSGSVRTLGQPPTTRRHRWVSCPTNTSERVVLSGDRVQRGGPLRDGVRHRLQVPLRFYPPRRSALRGLCVGYGQLPPSILIAAAAPWCPRRTARSETGS
jgi:hypothetical protein